MYFCYANDWRLWIIFSVTLVLVGLLFKFRLYLYNSTLPSPSIFVGTCMFSEPLSSGR